MQPACRVCDDDVGALGLGPVDGVEDHRARIRAVLGANDVHIRPISPDGQLLLGGGSEGIGRGQHHLVTGLAVLHGQFADGGGFARAVDAHDQDHKG